ncbi:MAG TPA: hypothetical protein VHY48_05570 [Acidobacteriaceae bacterium]|jgi:hypothetical protein|nr:hypothetical protein [Acidobacteriaceae bacterium]
MSYRPFRSISRFLLAACAVSFATVSLNAQTTAAPSENNPSRADFFAGYSYFGAHGQVQPADIRYSSVDEGAIGSGAYYFNKYFGGEFTFIANPDGQNDGVYGAYAGPIVRAPMQNFTLFAHAAAGGVKIGGPNSEDPATFEHEPYIWGPGLLVGGGMDYDLPFMNHRIGLRLFQADYRYIHADFGPPTSIPTPGVLGGRANVGAAELSSGLLVHFGHIIPPPPVAYACSVTTPTGTIYPGDVVTITGTATNLNPKRTPAYSWTGDQGVVVSGTSNVASIDTKALNAGTYTVKGHVSEGKKPGEMADCSATFTVTQFQPPTVGCAANPSTVNPGEPSTITANGVSPQNRPLTYSYSATAGSISGNTSTATLTTTGVAPGTITVTCNVVDDKGQTASQETTVTVSAPPPPPAPATKSLCTISFDRDHRRPTRVDNEAKACLDDIALSAQQDPTAKLAIVGGSEANDRHPDWATKRAEERAVNEKEYLVTEKGIDASRITVYTGTAGTNTAATTLIPDGATFDTTGLTPVDEATVHAQPRNAPVRHRHHHHHAAAAAAAANQ